MDTRNAQPAICVCALEEREGKGEGEGSAIRPAGEARRGWRGRRAGRRGERRGRRPDALRGRSLLHHQRPAHHGASEWSEKVLGIDDLK